MIIYHYITIIITILPLYNHYYHITMIIYINNSPVLTCHQTVESVSSPSAASMALLLIYFLFRLIKSQCFPCCKFTNTTGRSSISQLTIQVKILRKKSRFLRNINNLGMLHVFLSKTTGGCVRKKYDNLKRPN